MYPLIRRYLRRVDVVYLLLCAACSAISVVVLLSIGQTQLGSNNKASVQLIASLLGLMLAVVFSTADYHALARAWPLHGVVAWGLVLPTLFLHNVNTGLVTIGYDAGGTSNYSWYRVGGMTFQPAELAKISFILTLALHLSQVRGQVNRPKNLLLLFVHIALPAAAIHVQGDDGTALVFLGIGLVMLYAGGLSHWLVAGGLTAGVVGGAALLTLRPGILKGYQGRGCSPGSISLCPTPGTILFLRIWQTFWAFWALRRCCCCCLRSACAHCAPVCNAPTRWAAISASASLRRCFCSV